MAGRFGETLGQYLRRERESRSVSLEELSRNTRIGLPYLEALERDDFEFFPQREFILGFLKGYARHLGLEAEEVLRKYRLQAELTSRKETYHQMPLFPGKAGPAEEVREDRQEIPKAPPARKRKPFPWKILLQIIIVVVAISLSLYILHLLKNAQNTAPPEKALMDKAGNETPIPRDELGPEKREKDQGTQEKRK